MRSFWFLPAFVLASCSPTDGVEDRKGTSGSDDRYGDTSESDGGDADADGDSDSDADADSDTDADYDTGAETDTDTDSGDPEDTGEACNDVDPVTLYISPDDSNSMSAAVLARMAVLDGWGSIASLPTRTHEFMNYYDFDYPPAEPGSLRITPSMVASEDGTWSLQIGVSSPAVTNDERDAMNLVFSLDTSCSMKGVPLANLKSTMGAIAANLRKGDVVSLIQWAEVPEIQLEEHAITGPNDEALLKVVAALAEDGTTNLSEGLALAYDVAERNHSASMLSRVVLITDGGANVGLTDEKRIAAYAAREFGEGIYLAGVGVGTGATYEDEVVDTITDLGKGASTFVGDEAEAVRTFGGERFVQLFDVAARDVRIELKLPAGFEFLRTSAEEVSSNPAEVEPQNLASDDSIVMHNVITTCAPDLVNDASAVLMTVSWEDPSTAEAKSTSGVYTFAELLAVDPGLLQKGAAVFAYAEVFQLWKERGNGADRTAAVAAALETVAKAQDALPGDADLAEIRSVLEAF